MSTDKKETAPEAKNEILEEAPAEAEAVSEEAAAPETAESQEAPKADKKSRREEKKAARKKDEEKLAALENENAVLNDKYLRICAEYDNFRRRSQKEKDGLYGDIKADTVQ